MSRGELTIKVAFMCDGQSVPSRVCVGGSLSCGPESSYSSAARGWVCFNIEAFLRAGIESARQAVCGGTRLMGLHHQTDSLMTINLSHLS